MKKYLKIFVVCFCLFALLSVSCFATSVQTTSTSAAYGHYISPGDYIFDDILDFSMLSIPNDGVYDIYLNFSSSSSSNYSRLHFNHGAVGVYALSYMDPFFTVYDTYNLNGWINQESRYITVLDGFYIYNPSDYSFWTTNLTRVSPGYDSNLLDGFFSSFTMIGQWISGAANTLTSMFWSNNSLTFLGTLSVSALAFAVAFLIIGLISRFLRFRG